jgi:hypothetical protein
MRLGPLNSQFFLLVLHGIVYNIHKMVNFDVI